MTLLTQELRCKFLDFHAVYEWTRIRLEEEGADSHVAAVGAWKRAKEEVTLTPAELRLYKKLMAQHAANGGVLFESFPHKS